MAVSGLVKAIYASLALVILIQILNGWVQGMGWWQPRAHGWSSGCSGQRPLC
ncbi:MAG: hypothetical protein H0X67_06815 [Acidobacteria bacterium]|nr:hypothetical protein [Acidobacteriota bacterium]